MATADKSDLVRANDWPLVGRRQELRYLTEVLLPPARGVVLAGGAGVGKTRLAREALAGAEAAGRRVVLIRATDATRATPWGTLAHVLRPEWRGRADPAASIAGLAASLGIGHGEPPPVVAVDDAHLMDDLSAAALLHLASSGDAGVIVTVRSGSPLPGPVAALYQDGLLSRMEVQPLSRREVRDLLESVLGSQIAEAALGRLWAASDGNALYLRELVLDALDAGALRETGGVWNWSGGVGPAARLSEVIGARLTGLGRAETECLELLAVGEPLDAAWIEELVPAADLGHLERGGQVVTAAAGRRSEVRLAHPLYAEVIGARLGAYQRRRISRRLADHLEATGCRRAEDAMRLARWGVASGTASESPRLAAAAEQANRLHDALGAEVLARAALRLEPSAAASLQLGAALVDQGRYTEAEAALAAVAPAALDDPGRKALAYLRMRALFYGLGRMADADRALEAVEAATVAEPQRLAIRGWRAMMQVHAGRFSEAAVLSAPLAASTDPAARLMGASNVAVVRLLAGRIAEATALTDECVELTRGREEEPRLLRVLRVLALCADGRVIEAAEVVAALASSAEDTRCRPGDGAVADTLRGHVLLLEGRPRSALRALRQAAAVLRDHDSGGFLGWCLAQQVEGAALLGEAALARSAYDETLALDASRGVQIFAGASARSLAWRGVAEGDWTSAARELEGVADRLADRGELYEAVRALHDATRLGAPAAAGRLVELAPGTDSALARSMALHAGGRLARDALEVGRAAEALSGAGCPLLAVDAALDAAELAARSGLARRAASYGERARRWVEAVEGARTPAMARAQAPIGLTRREHEVARMAADGLSNRVIAARLGTSVRTVEGHLQQAYVKLGVDGRSALGPLLDRGDRWFSAATTG